MWFLDGAGLLGAPLVDAGVLGVPSWTVKSKHNYNNAGVSPSPGAQPSLQKLGRVQRRKVHGGDRQ